MNKKRINRLARNQSHFYLRECITFLSKFSKTANMASTSGSDSARVLKHHQQELPNLLLSTTYALNKSNSKRAIIGLEHYAGLYRPVVKLGGGGSPSKYVTLDSSSWDFIVDQMDTMNAYLQNSFTFCEDFGSPIRVYLQNHDIHFTQAYGSRAIAIDERPVIIGKDGKVEPTISKDNADDNATSEPLAKKKKFDNPPSIAMQLPTFEGLRQVRECISLRLKYLTTHAILVNGCIDKIMPFIKEKLKENDAEKVKSILKDLSVFKQYYSLIAHDVKNELDNMDFVGEDDNIIETFLHELNAFCLPLIAKDLYEEMCEK